MLLALAAWRTEDGLAIAVWEKPHATLLRLMGLDTLPVGEPLELWIGP